MNAIGRQSNQANSSNFQNGGSANITVAVGTPSPLASVSAEPLQSLAINDVLCYCGKLMRLIAANPLSNIAYIIEISNVSAPEDKYACKTALPFVNSYRHLCAEGVRVEDPMWNRPLAPSTAVQAVREARYERIRDLIKNPSILNEKTRGPILVEHAKKVGVSKKTLLSDLRTWWQRGQVKDALLADYHRSGRVTDSTEGAIVIDEESINGIKHVVLAPARDKARGRHPLDGRYTPMNMSAQEKARILKVGRKKYEQDNTVSMRSVVANVINDLYSVRNSEGVPRKDSKGNPVLPPLGSRPTHRQISYLLKTVLSVAKTYIKRHGTADFLNNRAPTTGTVLDDCIGPADVYEGDDTTFDYHISSESDITVILGKVTLHLVVDRYTRLIVGFYLSLDASCWEDAKLALLSVCNDWKALCKKHGITYFPADFPAQGVMCNRFFADRGPYMTFASDEMTNAGTDATNAPALLSRSKPIVESTFKRVNKLISEMPGYEPQWNVTKRRRKPFEADACLTLTQLEGVVLRAIIALNREVLKDYPQSPADSAQGLLPIPRDIWSREIARLNALPRRISREWLCQALLSRDIATVTQDGIRFKGNYYTCKEALEKDWFAIASIGSHFDVTVRYTPKNLDEILVQDPKHKDVRYVAQLTTKSLLKTGNTPGLTEARSCEIADQRRKIRRDADTQNLLQRVGFLQDVAPVVDAAKTKMLVETKGKSLASRKNPSLEVREAEAEQRRKANHNVATEGPSIPVDVPVTETKPDPVAVDESQSALLTEITNALSDPSVMANFFESLDKV